MAREGAIRRVADWLRAGYPGGVPEHDYVAVLALLKRTLTHDEVIEVADRIVLAHPGGGATHEAVAAEIEGLLEQEALTGDVARVSAVLAAAGWPLADVDA
ncbi:DUF3349 domain-containing protein [Cellulomonas rhizosphaerae]|uniref:DUF3349 domain-containing protein n=1 Tax=Cellulomonas rhizosphaerae TaxID=2293719 RepID=A0A413RPW1_9CELL|nr:DUF3349 domain-containing protein [Cellulomonas rhizosphaerae]RHA43997.1 DUF3349 domain-containing protein [Cellulomonas rhizosphaerae]